MFRLSIRNLLAKKLRLLTTAIAIVLGVAFTTGTMILADTMSASFSSALDEIADGVDTVVRGERVGVTAVQTPRIPVDVADIEIVRAVEGVEAVVPYAEGYAQVIGADGKAIDTSQSVGLNWIADPELSMFEIVEGRSPEAPGQVVLHADTAKLADVTVGDSVDVITRAGQETFLVVGLSQFDGGSSFGATAFVFFDDADTGGRLTDAGSTTALLARGDGTMSEEQLTERVDAMLGDRYDVVTGAQQTAEQKSDLGDAVGVFETILLVFGGIALFVGSFTIANTFTITIAQRTRELALVRAIGGSRRQILGSVVIEAAVIGTLSAIVGLAGGLGVAKTLTSLFAAIGLEFPARALVVAPSTIAAAFATGVLVTVGAAIVPARRAAKVAPVDAIRDASIERVDTSPRRTIIGATLAAIGAAGLAGGVLQNSAALVGLGSVAAFIAVITLGPVLIAPIAAVLSAPLRRLGVSGRLASANATRNPKRSAATAAALTIGVMLVAGASMFASTAKATISGDAAEVIVADRVIRPIGVSPGVPTDVANTASAVPGSHVVPVHVVDALVDDEYEGVAGLDLAAASGMLDLAVIDGAVSSDPTEVIVGDQIADDRGWALGEDINIVFVDGVSTTVSVGAIFEQTIVLPPVIGSYDAVAAHGNGLDRMVLVAGDAATLTAVASSIEAAPTVVLDTVDEYAASLSGSLDMILSLVIGFLGLAVVIAILGIATTIGLAVHERNRELGVLRAVGMSRRQLRTSIRLESIVIAMFGTALGLGTGIGFTWAVLATLDEQGFAAPVVPIPTIVSITVGALIAGMLAAALPARRAARIPVLDAIHTD